MYNIIPLVLILISLVVIIVIVAKKSSVLASLDVENIQAEKEQKFKEQIISNRLKRNFFKYWTKIIRIVKPTGQAIGDSFKWIYKKLVDFKDNYNKEIEVKGDIKRTISQLFSEAEELIKRDNLEQAEKKYIEIIGLDSRNNKAFKELGRLYFNRKDYNEAKQTFEHILKLAEQEYSRYSNGVQSAEMSEDGLIQDKAGQDINSRLAGIYFDLALVCRAMEDIDEALANINKALKIESNNPRYLDTKLEMSIINKDKATAMDAYEKLAVVNLDNQKLEEFKKQIGEL